jgi:Uma2 family endonuclease
MSQNTQVMTADELLSLPDCGQRYELVQGELRMMSPAGGRHGRIALKLARRLGDYVEQQNLGETFAAETGFLLKQNPDTVRAPDVAFVSHARLGKRADYTGYLPVAPDLVAEVVSPNDSSSAVEKKALDWLAAGVVVVLVVDPQTKTIRAYRSTQEIRVYAEGCIDLDDVMVGCELNVAELFAQEPVPKPREG